MTASDTNWPSKKYVVSPAFFDTSSSARPKRFAYPNIVLCVVSMNSPPRSPTC